MRGGAFWVDGALAEELDSQWTATAGANVAYRITPQVAIGAGLWGGSLDRGDADGSGGAILGGGSHLVLAPFAERDWRADLVLGFGLEGIRIDDDEDRSPAFVFGAGIRRRWNSRWALEAAIRNHFLTIDEEPVDGIATGRDATLWDIAVEVVWAPGGRRGG